MKKYKIRLQRRWSCSAEITEVEVEKESDKCIWINGSRCNKESEYSTYFDTFEEAKNALTNRQKSHVKELKSRLKHAKFDLNEIEDLKQ